MTTFRRPRIQLQLRDPNTGRFDCTAYAVAMGGDAHSVGVTIFTGRQIRLASDEPIPDPASPGLNIRQGDEALYKLSKGAVNLDTQWNVDWAQVDADVRAGKWAVVALWREVLLDHGIGTANRFGQGHASLFTFDQVAREFILLDPLISTALVVPSSVVRQACAELLIRNGVGAPVGAYVGMTRDVWPLPGVTPAPVRHYSIRFRRGVSFFTYRVGSDLKIESQRETERFEEGSSTFTSAPCSAPRNYYYPAIRANRRLVRITRGRLAGKYVQPGASGVQLVEAA